MNGRFRDFWEANEDITIRGQFVARSPQREFAIEPIGEDKLEGFWSRYVRPEQPTPSPADILRAAGVMASAGPFEDATPANNRGDDPTAMRLFRPFADEGDADAQFNLGLMYTDGLGVPRDYSEAVKWFQKAADQGNAVAQFNLGHMYADGWGVPQNDAEAVRWYRKAADQALAHA